ncbi:MAG TPA: hypothetical protein DCM28_08410 [Phycisphaerales bacterium]|nr:hypothetical protein [Phycisphaerales bacterium]HCD35086.1 hypothetical protein [Phycisphaerales bacterium]|tara:strand:- start:768 stop:1217 length:450 start_codon:yes stop_codon:yes gene_type:complete
MNSSWLLMLALESPRTPKTPPNVDEIFTNWQWINHSDPLMSPLWAIAIMSVIIFAMLVLRIIKWRRSSNRQDGPLLVFHQVAKQLEIDITTQWLLIKVAQQQGLPNPLTLLICDSTFAHHAKAYIKSLPNHRQKHILDQLSHAHQHLFA